MTESIKPHGLPGTNSRSPKGSPHRSASDSHRSTSDSSRSPIDGAAIRNRFFDSLEDATQLLRLFDFLPNVFLYVKDAEGRFVAINEHSARMRGLNDQSEHWGKTDLDIHPAYWGRQYQEEDRRVMREGREIPNQVWMVPAVDKRLGTFMSSKIPIRDRQGNVIGLAGVMYRIDTEVKHSTDATILASEYISKHFGDPIDISEIAKFVSLSPSQLNRRFKSKFGISPSEYLQRVRVYQASRLLGETGQSVTKIAMECGFYDAPHFTRSFRRRMGVTPTQFRRMMATSRSPEIFH